MSLLLLEPQEKQVSDLLIMNEPIHSFTGSTCLYWLLKKKKVEVLVAQACPLFVTPWIAAHQAPLSVGFYRLRILEWISSPFSRGSS